MIVGIFLNFHFRLNCNYTFNHCWKKHRKHKSNNVHQTVAFPTFRECDKNRKINQQMRGPEMAPGSGIPPFSNFNSQ